jgi:hypothetical protein
LKNTGNHFKIGDIVYRKNFICEGAYRIVSFQGRGKIIVYEITSLLTGTTEKKAESVLVHKEILDTPLFKALNE